MKLKRLLGNGMHLVTQATWMMYVLLNTAARESGDAVLRVISPKPRKRRSRQDRARDSEELTQPR